LREEGARELTTKLLQVKDGKEGGGKLSGRSQRCGGARPGGAEKGRGRKEREAPTGGTLVSAAVGKRKGRSGPGPLRKRDVGPVGRCGLKGKKVRFFFFFSNTIKSKLINSNSFKTF
jgi:hypothetical protein